VAFPLRAVAYALRTRKKKISLLSSRFGISVPLLITLSIEIRIVGLEPLLLLWLLQLQIPGIPDSQIGNYMTASSSIGHTLDEIPNGELFQSTTGAIQLTWPQLPEPLPVGFLLSLGNNC
jgi:hypothetical protein